MDVSEPTIYLIDDDPAVLQSLTALVEVVFPRVRGYTSATDFLADYDFNEPGCLVLDVAMPGMSGLELQRKLNEEKIELPIVFITGHGNVQMAVGAMQAGAVNFLEKPFHEQELWDSVRSALEHDAASRRRKRRRADVYEKLTSLSDGERAVLDLIIEGKLNKEIAGLLSLSTRTVEDRRARIMKKMGARSVAELVQLTLTH